MPNLRHPHSSTEPIDYRILIAALGLFVEKGYHNVSVHDIQAKANVSTGSIYKHFGGKEGIARTLYKRLLEEMDELIEGATKQYITARDRGAHIVRSLFEYTETNPNFIAYIFHAKHTEFISNQQPICNSSAFIKLRNIVQEGMDSGELRKTDPSIAVASFFGCAIRMIHLRLDGMLENPLPSYTEELLDAMWHGMAADLS